MLKDRRFLSVLFIFLSVSMLSLVLTLSPDNIQSILFVIVVTAFSFIFAWLARRKVTPIPPGVGTFRNEIVQIAIFFVLIMAVRLTGFNQQFILAEKAGMIALTFATILLVDRSGMQYFGLVPKNILKQLLFGIIGFGVMWVGFCLYRIGIPFIFGLDSTGILIEFPTFDLKFIIFIIALLFWNFAEELFFRGFILTKLEKSAGFWIGLVISSALFGLYHINYILSYGGSDPIGYISMYILFTAIFGFGMGLLYKISGSVLTVTITHALWNIFFAGGNLIPKVYINHGRSYLPSSDYDYMFATIFFALVMLFWYFAAKRNARKCGIAF
jgi:membrane protease YdiL (CAAX protease family)